MLSFTSYFFANIKFRTAYGQANKNIDKMNYTAVTHPLNN